LHTVGRNVKWYICYGKHHSTALKISRIEFPHDPAILLLGIYVKELKMGSQQAIHVPMFIGMSLTMAKK
jgi:hypothetical protein